MSRDGCVEVSAMQRDDKSIYFQITVWGAQFFRSAMQGIVEFGAERRENAVMTVAGALAEELCERLGDTQLDPDKAAHTALAAYRELMAGNPHLLPGDEAPREYDRAISRQAGVVIH